MDTLHIRLIDQLILIRRLSQFHHLTKFHKWETVSSFPDLLFLCRHAETWFLFLPNMITTIKTTLHLLFWHGTKVKCESYWTVSFYSLPLHCSVDSVITQVGAAWAQREHTATKTPVCPPSQINRHSDTVKSEDRPQLIPPMQTFPWAGQSPTVPFDFAPPCPLMAEPIESFRIRLLGGRTLDRRKWCWSWHWGTASAEVWGCWVEPRAARFGGEAGRSGAVPGLRAVADGLRSSTPSSPFVLRSSLACSPLSSSSQPSGFLDGFLLPSTPIPSLELSVMLPKHIQG